MSGRLTVQPGREIFLGRFKNAMLNFDFVAVVGVAAAFLCLLELEPFVKLSSCAGNNQKGTCYECEHTFTSMWWQTKEKKKDMWKINNTEKDHGAHSLTHQNAEQNEPNRMTE